MPKIIQSAPGIFAEGRDNKFQYSNTDSTLPAPAVANL